jgi:hypothetical protein
MTRRRWMLVLGLCATVVAAWFAPSPQADGGVELSDRSIRAGAAIPGGPSDPVRESGVRNGRGEPEVLTIRARSVGEETDPLSELFASPSWASVETKPATAARSPVVVSETSPPPTAPPLPFVFMGRMSDGGQQTYFLRHGDQSIVAQVGDTLLNQYRVEALDGNKLVLRYLPLNQLQSLELGSSL